MPGAFRNVSLKPLLHFLINLPLFFCDAKFLVKIKLFFDLGAQGGTLQISPCILKGLKLSWQGEDAPVKYHTTGFELQKNSFLFDNCDPKIIIEEIPQGGGRVEVSYQISILEEETAVLLMDKINTRGRVKKKLKGLVKGSATGRYP